MTLPQPNKPLNPLLFLILGIGLLSISAFIFSLPMIFPGELAPYPTRTPIMAAEGSLTPTTSGTPQTNTPEPIINVAASPTGGTPSPTITVTQTSTPTPPGGTETLLPNNGAATLTMTMTPATTLPPGTTATIMPAGTMTVTLTPGGSAQTTPTKPTTAYTGALDYIPGGSFMMGAPTSDAVALDDERPEHSVSVGPYWLGHTEVTNQEYSKCVTANACTAPRADTQDMTLNDYNNASYANFPVVYITRAQAVSFCTWAGGRLPTEAEWEFAARGPNSNKYPWGSAVPGCDLANYDICSDDSIQVGSKPGGKGAYGSLDLAGNVSEIVNDWYEPYAENLPPQTNPTGPTDSTDITIKGGSFYVSSLFLRSSWRTFDVDDYSDFDLGFRCAWPVGRN